jgi:putative peptidoglycan lipid II flippase
VKVGRAIWLSGATMASRLLGLLRDQLFAILIGANRWSDAFVVAFRIPNLLRDLFAEGALSSAFVPTFAEVRRNRGADEAWRLAGTVVSLVLVVVGAIVLAGITWADQVVAASAPGLGEFSAFTAGLARVMMPFLLLVSLSAVAMGMLNAQGRFTAPALAPALFNVGSIAVGLGLWWAGWPPERAVQGWALGTMLGGLLQLLAQVPSLRATGWRPMLGVTRARLADPGLRRIGRLMAASVIGLSATQVNILVNQAFASYQAGAATWLQMAFRLMQLPLGVFGVAIATVAGAGVAQAAAARDLPAAKKTLGSALRLVAFFNVPSAVGLAVVGGPIVSLIYQHGLFGAADAEATAQALACYALGLYAYSAVKVMAPAFYALDRARVPVIGSILGMAANVGLNLALYPVLGFRGVALGTSLAAGANLAVLLVAWRRAYGGLGGAGLLPQLARVVAASAVLAVVAWGSAALLRAALPPGGLWRQAVIGLLPVALGAGVYFAVSRWLGVEELGEVLAALRRKPTPDQA